MTEKKLIVEVERIINGANVTLRKEITEGENIQTSVEELCEALRSVSGFETLAPTASIASPSPLPHGLAPTPQIDVNVLGLPILENPPHSYTPGDAVIELLNPQKSNWATQPRAVKEIQTRLMELGVRGVASLQTFDGVMRRLLKQGKVRREKMGDGGYKYYAVATGGRSE